MENINLENNVSRYRWFHFARFVCGNGRKTKKKGEKIYSMLRGPCLVLTSRIPKFSSSSNNPPWTAYISERPLGPREFTTVYVLMAEFQPRSSGERIKKKKGKKEERKKERKKRESEPNGRSLNVAATNRISRVVDNRRRLNVTPTLPLRKIALSISPRRNARFSRSFAFYQRTSIPRVATNGVVSRCNADAGGFACWASRTKINMSVHKNIYDYTILKVFLRCDEARPCKVKQSVDDRGFIVIVNGERKKVSVERDWNQHL